MAILLISIVLISVISLATTEGFGLEPQGYNAVCSGEIKENIYFKKNDNERLLKKSGYMGTLEKHKENKIVDQVDLYTVCSESGSLSTDSLSFENLDYSIVEDEAASFAVRAFDVLQIQNYCRSVVYVNYKSKNRAKIDLKVTKTYVDGSNGLAPYAGVWDLRSDMVISNIDVGLDKHYIKAVAPLIVANDKMLHITQPQTNAHNATVSLTESMSSTVQIQGGVEYDGKVPNIQVGGSYSFTYGYSKTYSFEQYSFSSTTVAYPDYDIWGYKMSGTKYKATANDKQYSVNHQLVQRFGYYDGDNDPDNLMAFIGIGGLKIDGKGLAPNLEIGDLEASENVNDANIFGILIGWKSDNSAHSYMGNVIGLSNINMDYSNSNLPEDVWTHSYGYGY